jgi:hypothetical protein
MGFSKEYSTQIKKYPKNNYNIHSLTIVQAHNGNDIELTPKILSDPIWITSLFG